VEEKSGTGKMAVRGLVCRTAFGIGHLLIFMARKSMGLSVISKKKHKQRA
jgi:hypothetical protein